MGENKHNIGMGVDKVGEIPYDNGIEVSTKFLGFFDIGIEIVRAGIWRDGLILFLFDGL